MSPPAAVRSVYRAVLPQPVQRRIRHWRYHRPRHVSLRLPAAPDGHPRPARLRMTAPRGMLVPRMLDTAGLAGYEPETLAVFLAAVDLAPPGAVYDIGANVGVYGLLARALSDRDVHAFEPVPELAQIADATAAANQLPYDVVRAAVGREVGEAPLHLSDSSDSSNSLNAGFRASTRTLMVPVTTLDAYVEKTRATPAVVKIDAETGEPDVLAGGREAIRAHRPWLLLEILPRRTEPAILAEMQQWDYTWYRCVGDLPFARRVDLDVVDKAVAPMWLMLPAPATPEFWARAEQWLTAVRACVP